MKYRNLKAALKDGYKVNRISYWQYFELFEIICYRGLSGKKLSFWVKKVPQYLKSSDIDDFSSSKTERGDLIIIHRFGPYNK